ncbi:DUF2207 family protein [Paucilactobacillus sp. N302-9]
MRKEKNMIWWCIMLCVAVAIGLMVVRVAILIVGQTDAKNYKINQLTINAKIDKTGGAWVTESVRYTFDGDYNGVYIVQDTNDLGKMSNLSVKIDGQTANRSSYATNGDSGYYKISHNKDGEGHNKKGYERIKIYNVMNSGQMDVQCRFYLSKVAKRYRDTGEINWKPIGSNWDRLLQRAKITITLPQAAKPIKSWFHSPEGGKQSINQRTATITATGKHISRYMELHMLFAKSAINQAPKHDTNRVKQALKIEKRVSDWQNFRMFLVYLFKNNWLVAVVIALLPILFLIPLYLKWQDKFVRQDLDAEKLHRFDLPEIEPALASAWYEYEQNGDNFDTRVFITFLIDCQSNGLIKLKHEDKYFEIIKTTQEAIDPFVDYLIDKVGDHHKVSMKQLKKYGETNSEAKALSKKWKHFNKQWITQIRHDRNINPKYEKFQSNLSLIGLLWEFFGSIPVISMVGYFYMALVWWEAIILVFLIWGFLLSVYFYWIPIIIYPVKWISKSWGDKIDQWKKTTPLYTRIFFCFSMVYVALIIFNLHEINWLLISSLVALLVGTGIIVGFDWWIKKTFTVYTKKGYQTYLQVRQFKQMLHDIADFDQSQLPDHILWGQYLTYAIGLGEAKRLNRQLQSKFGAGAVTDAMLQQLDIDDDYWLYGGFTTFTASFNSGLAGGTTGPGGGSSGGAGGGSGGGAF